MVMDCMILITRSRKCCEEIYVMVVVFAPWFSVDWDDFLIGYALLTLSSLLLQISE